MICREAHTLLEELAEATLAGTHKDYVMELASVPPQLVASGVGLPKYLGSLDRRSRLPPWAVLLAMSMDTLPLLV